jgi:aspartyl-tRNA synthetase
LVLNGNEVGGGSIRIHKADIQEKIFNVLSSTGEELRKEFEFLLEALRLGAPPHGGIALGVDRIMMIMLGKNSIREVIAFPKTHKGACPLTRAPAPVSGLQLNELGIRVVRQ